MWPRLICLLVEKKIKGPETTTIQIEATHHLSSSHDVDFSLDHWEYLRSGGGYRSVENVAEQGEVERGALERTKSNNLT